MLLATLEVDKFTYRLGYWSGITIAVLVVLIDIGMIASAILFPTTTITSIESYEASFTSAQMLPFIPSLMLGTLFVIFMLCIYHFATADKKILGELGFSFAVVCAVILSLHYCIQLTLVQQGLLNGETAGLWMFVTPNPHSLFWTLAALVYGFMGFALLSTAPIFNVKSERIIRLLFVANGVLGMVFTLSNMLSFFVGNILVSFIWGVIFPIAALLVAKTFKQTSQQTGV
jgi:hypothetical protein